MEYHAFGIISEGRKSGCHYMICGVQGDFTKALVNEPPKTVWTRELKFGMFQTAPLVRDFANGLKLVSGTPPGCSSAESESAREQASAPPCPPASKAPTGTHPPTSPPQNTSTNTPARFLIWIGSDQEKTFGPTVTNLIYNNIEPERMILWDSKKRGGRPDTVQLLKETWDSFGAEVIFITSNMKGNDEMMQGCRAGEFPWPAITFRVCI